MARDNKIGSSWSSLPEEVGTDPLTAHDRILPSLSPVQDRWEQQICHASGRAAQQNSGTCRAKRSRPQWSKTSQGRQAAT